MKKATQDSVLNYARTGQCPYCGKCTDSPPEDESYMEDSFYCYRHCDHCKKKWSDIFRFVGILPASDDDAVYCSKLHASINSEETTTEPLFKCPKCGSNELNNDNGSRDWEGEEGYFEELTCSCGAIIVATYIAHLDSVQMKDEPRSFT